MLNELWQLLVERVEAQIKSLERSLRRMMTAGVLLVMAALVALLGVGVLAYALFALLTIVAGLNAAWGAAITGTALFAVAGLLVLIARGARR